MAAYEIAVRDTGVGMSEEEIAHALTPFGQNENRFTGKHDGTGLGLPLAKAMLELHGGSSDDDQRPGSGHHRDPDPARRPGRDARDRAAA